MKHILKYFDNNSDHCFLWPKMDDGFQPLKSIEIENIFENIEENNLHSSLSKYPDKKYLLILHTGESYFRQDINHRLETWELTWDKLFSAELNRIVIVFVSGDIVPIYESQLPLNQLNRTHFIINCISDPDQSERLANAILTWKRGFEFTIDNALQAKPVINSIKLLCEFYLTVYKEHVCDVESIKKPINDVYENLFVDNATNDFFKFKGVDKKTNDTSTLINTISSKGWWLTPFKNDFPMREFQNEIQPEDFKNLTAIPNILTSGASQITFQEVCDIYAEVIHLEQSNCV